MSGPGSRGVADNVSDAMDGDESYAHLPDGLPEAEVIRSGNRGLSGPHYRIGDVRSSVQRGSCDLNRSR